MQPQSALETDMARLGEAQQRVDALKARIEQLKAQGSPTELYEQLMRTVESRLHLMQAHLRRSTKSPIAYRCYLMNGERIQGVRIFEAPDDAEVLIRAGGLLRTHPEHQAMEIWAGKRLVALLSRNLLASWPNVRPGTPAYR
jgi:hypothetical protein